MPSWPSSLPQTLQQNGYSQQPLDNATPIDVESGEPLTRLRFTGDMEDVAGSLVLDGDDLCTFRNFWKYDLDRGTQRFSWSDQISGEAVEFIFTASPKYSNLGIDIWQVDISLRMIS